MPDRIVDRINVGGEEYHLEPVIDASPVQGSVHAVSSGGTWQALQDHDIFENPVLFNKVFGRDVPKFFKHFSTVAYDTDALNITYYMGKIIYFNGLYIMYGGGSGIRYRSSLTEGSWTTSSSFAADTRIIDVIEAEGALWGITNDTTYKGIWRSTNGTSWTKLSSLDLKVNSIYYSSDDNTFIAGTESGIYISTDSGATFTSAGGPNNAASIGRTDYGADVLFAGTSSNGLWHSSNYGRTWTQVSTIPSTADVRNIPVYNDSLGKFCVGTDSGIYYASGNGSIYTITSVTYKMQTVVCNKNVFIAAGSDSKGLYWSFDAINWNKSSDFADADVLPSCRTIVFRNGIWVALIKTSGASTYSIIWSTNGINWFYVDVKPYTDVSEFNYVGDISYVNGVWIFSAGSTELISIPTWRARTRLYMASAETLASSGFFGD